VRRVRRRNLPPCDAVRLTTSEGVAKVILSKLKNLDLLYVHGYAKKHRLYRVCDPDIMVWIVAGRIGGLSRMRQGAYPRLLGITTLELMKNVKGIQSVVVYGSVARGEAKPESDIDLLVVYDSAGSIGKRLDQLLEIEEAERITAELDWLQDHGIETHLSFLPLNPAEAKEFPPILLDVLEDGIPLSGFDYHQKLAEGLKVRVRSSGSRLQPTAPVFSTTLAGLEALGIGKTSLPCLSNQFRPIIAGVFPPCF